MKARADLTAWLAKAGKDLPADVEIWDLSMAPRGLTVLLSDGRVLPVEMPEAAAQRLLHGFSAEMNAAQQRQG